MMRIKRIFFILLLNITLLSIAACNKAENQMESEWREASEGIDELNGVWIETENETYEKGTLIVRVKWFNTLNDQMTYGQSYLLEKKVNDKWKVVTKETTKNYGFTAIGFILEPNSTRWQSHSLEYYTDGLTPGKYRINATFSRNTLNGVDYGRSGYPRYQVYGYFTVGNKNKERELTVLDDSVIEYKNEEYGFAIELPKDWDGYRVIEEQQNKESEKHEIFQRLDEDYVIVRIRHPNWTQETPYQDIVLTMFHSRQWRENMKSFADNEIDKIPEVKLYSRYYIVLNPDDYDESYREYQTVQEMLESLQNY